MKKVIKPILHIAFLIPMTAIAMGSIEFIAQTFDLLPDYFAVFKIPYVFLITSIIIISGIPLFWLANRMMQALKKLKKPTLIDHVWQSIFYYFIIAFCLINWVFSGFDSGENDVYFVTWLIISIVAIVVNYLFLFYSGKSTSPDNV